MLLEAGGGGGGEGEGNKKQAIVVPLRINRLSSNISNVEQVK